METKRLINENASLLNSPSHEIATESHKAIQTNLATTTITEKPLLNSQIRNQHLDQDLF